MTKDEPVASMAHQVACIECRQQKVKCLGRTENNGSCDRCTKRRLECVVDESYKRTAKRKVIDTLESEISELRKQVEFYKGRCDADTRTSDLPSPKFVSQAQPAQMPPPPVVSSFFSPPRTALDSDLNDVTLDSSSIEILFREYVNNYHRVLPCVEVQHGPQFVYDASEALFWTIMSIASRRISTELPVGINFSRLSSVQKRMLSEVAISPVLGHGRSFEFNLPSVYVVQAFLLCTLWPPPTASINADMSWNASGIACLTAVRAGLHCPGHGSDFERIFKSNQTHRANIREQLVTWLATNALTQAIANMFGYPSAASFRSHTQYAFHNVDLPIRVRHMYEIQRIAHEIEHSLGQMSAEPTIDTNMASSLIRIHASRYDEIESQFGRDMDPWSLFTLYAGRAQLFSYYLFGNVQQEQVLALYNSCLALLNHVVVQPDEYVQYLPVVSIMILWQTASMLARLWHSRWSTYLDKATGETIYKQAIHKVELSSVFEHDLPFRAAEIMNQMWTTFSVMRMKNHHKAISATLTLKSRMSASVFFDSLWTMREQVEIDSQAPTKLTRPTTPLQLSTNTPPEGVPRASSIFSSANESPPTNVDIQWDTNMVWQDVNTVMEDFGFGLGELPYFDPA